MRPEDITGKQVLYGCLDWGGGHLARSIPLLHQLARQGNRLTVRCTFTQRSVLETYGVPAAYHIIEGFSFHFKGDGNFVREMVRNALRFRKAIQQERAAIAAYIDEHPVDYLISDHSYGLHDPRAHSIFVTHQVQLPPKSGFLAQWIHRRWLKPFRTIWIMDEEHTRLAGKLSTATSKSVYIGHYSRFAERSPVTAPLKGIVAVISGPQPYAQQLFDTIVRVANQTGGDWTIVCGGACTDSGKLKFGRIIRNDWKASDEAILRAERVISRNGYSTLMDLKVLHKPAIFIPTPGQLEQVYLQTINANPDWLYADSVEDIGRMIGGTLTNSVL